jgi:CubicO group peptidase (beta-lactamase class C family)
VPVEFQSVQQFIARIVDQGRVAGAGIILIGTYGHAGGTGCVGRIDPAHGVTVAFVSNSHADHGWDEWRDRLEESVNVTIAAVTAPEDRSVHAGSGR